VDKDVAKALKDIQDDLKALQKQVDELSRYSHSGFKTNEMTLEKLDERVTKLEKS
jgi:peptidoglycan hydrolase CwlO-like protein